MGQGYQGPQLGRTGCAWSGDPAVSDRKDQRYRRSNLASNLGVVELTMAIYRTFDLPEDKVIWDVGHQAYTHRF